MRRLSMKSKKGKIGVNEGESSGQEEQEQSNGDNKTESDVDEASSDPPKRKVSGKRGKKKGASNSSADVEDVAKENKKKKKEEEEEEEEPPKESKKKKKTAEEEEEEEEPPKEHKKKKKVAEEEEESEEYEVETILDVREHRGKRQFKIRWKGYGSDGDTWEDEEGLSCPEIIKNFLEKQDQNEKKGKKRAGKVAKTSKKKQKVESGGESDNAADKGDDDEGDEDAKEYEVDKVMEVHFKKNGTREFLIHWKGFSHKDDTWEPEKHLNCPELIEKFMEKVSKAKSVGSKELRANPQHTSRFTLNMTQSGRRLSRRNQGKLRVTYHDTE